MFKLEIAGYVLLLVSTDAGGVSLQLTIGKKAVQAAKAGLELLRRR